MKLNDDWLRRFWILPTRGERPALQMTDRGTHLEILDTRPCAKRRETLLRGMARDVLLACDQGLSIEGIAAAVHASDREAVKTAVDELTASGLLLRHEERYLALPNRPPRKPLPAIWEYPGGTVYGEALRQLRKRMERGREEPLELPFAAAYANAAESPADHDAR